MKVENINSHHSDVRKRKKNVDGIGNRIDVEFGAKVHNLLSNY